MDDLLNALENCEVEVRDLIAEGKLSELEKPLRRFEKLLKEAHPEQARSAEYAYFCVVFHQINSGLYQNAGRAEGMHKHALEGKTAAEQLLERLPLSIPPENCPDKVKLMALNCAEFARVESLMLENMDQDNCLALLGQAIRLYDWLWPDLKEEPSILAVEVHLKRACLLSTFQKDEQGALDEFSIAQKKYLQLYERTGDPVYQEKARALQKSHHFGGERKLWKRLRTKL